MILIELLLRLDNHEDWYDINLGIVYLNPKSASKEVIVTPTLQLSMEQIMLENPGRVLALFLVFKPKI